MKSLSTGKLLMFAAAISTGYIVMETVHAISRTRATAEASDLGAAQDTSYSPTSAAFRPPAAVEEALASHASQPKVPSSTPMDPTVLVSKMDAEKYVALQQEQIAAMREELATRSPTDPENDMTAAEIDQMAAEGRMSW